MSFHILCIRIRLFFGALNNLSKMYFRMIEDGVGCVNQKMKGSREAGKQGDRETG